MDSQGYVVIWRKIMETSFYKNPLTCRLAEHLILKANYKDNKFLWNGKEITIERGELLTGLKQLHLETGISIQSIRTGLKQLENIEFLTNKSTNKFSIIKVLKYEDYQTPKDEPNKQINKQLTNNQQTTNKQLTTNNNINNINNVKNDNKDKSFIHKEPKKELQPHQKLIEEFKLLKGYDKDPSWNKLNFKRHVKIASELIKALEDGLEQAIFYMNRVKESQESKSLDWTLETVGKLGSNYYKAWQRQKGKGTPETPEILQPKEPKPEPEEEISKIDAIEILNRMKSQITGIAPNEFGIKRITKTMTEEELRNYKKDQINKLKGVIR